MPKVLPDIIYDRFNDSPTIDSSSSMYTIPLYKSVEYFSSLDSYTNFIKGCERLVRNSDRYKKYIYYLKTVVGLDRCQVLSDIEPDDKGKIEIEMHHGPIFTLYDYCAIILEYFIIKKWKISTFRIADAVLTEHEKDRVQVVMLSTTIHQQVHEREIFINYKQAWGDLNAFITKYQIALSEKHKVDLNKYIDRSMISDSDDFGLLKLASTVAKI